MVEAGEVYHDDLFDSELTIVEVTQGTVTVDDRVAGQGVRDLRREIDWEHNVSVGRYEKVDEVEEVHVPETQEPEKDEEPEEKGLFDY